MRFCFNRYVHKCVPHDTHLYLYTRTWIPINMNNFGHCYNLQRIYYFLSYGVSLCELLWIAMKAMNTQPSNTFFRSRAYTRKGSLEVIFFHPHDRKLCEIQFKNYLKIDLWDASYDHLWGPSEPEVNRKWTGNGLEVECEGSTSAGLLRPAIFALTII